MVKKGNELEVLRNLPKTDLHCHIDGSIRPSTILELAIKGGIKVPTTNLDEFENYVKVGGECKSLKEYLEKFEFPIKIFNKPKNIKRITIELLEDSAKHGVKYMELRFAPFLGEGIVNPAENVQAALEGMKEAKEKFKIDSNLILCAMTHQPVETSIEVAKLCNEFKDKGVVAMDLAGNEHDFDIKLHKKAFDLAHEYGVNITAHAGETGKSQNVIKAIKSLHANRIGHGIAAIKDEKIVDYLVKKQIPLEVCIKSNIDTKGVGSLEEHPFKELLHKGVKVTINTDDITVSNVNIMDEYKNLLDIGLSLKDITKVIKNGIEASFATTKVKQKLLSELELKKKCFKLTNPKLIKSNKAQSNLGKLSF